MSAMTCRQSGQGWKTSGLFQNRHSSAGDHLHGDLSGRGQLRHGAGGNESGCLYENAVLSVSGCPVHVLAPHYQRGLSAGSYTGLFPVMDG